MRAITTAAAVMWVVGCGKAQDPADCATTTEPPVPAADVCAHLADLGCRFEPSGSEVDAGGTGDPCLDGYAQWAAAVAPDEFAAVTHCYLGASSCEGVDGCNRTCGAGGGPVRVRDAGMGEMDAGPVDAGMVDGGSADGGGTDAGSLDAGAVDAGRPFLDADLPDARPDLPDAGIGMDGGP